MEALKVKKSIYTEPEIQFNPLSEDDILSNSLESEVDSDELLDDEEEE